MSCVHTYIYRDSWRKLVINSYLFDIIFYIFLCKSQRRLRSSFQPISIKLHVNPNTFMGRQSDMGPTFTIIPYHTRWPGWPIYDFVPIDLRSYSLRSVKNQPRKRYDVLEYLKEIEWTLWCSGECVGLMGHIVN